MRQVARILTMLTLLVAFSASLSGCAYALQDCSKLVGTSDYNLCLAENGDQEAQYQLGLAAYEAGNTDEAIKWLEKAAKRRDNRTPIFIPKGNSGDVRIEMRETGLSKPGHTGAQRLLEEITMIYNDISGGV